MQTKLDIKRLSLHNNNNITTSIYCIKGNIGSPCKNNTSTKMNGNRHCYRNIIRCELSYFSSNNLDCYRS